jgi:hypothetical protein
LPFPEIVYGQGQNTGRFLNSVFHNFFLKETTLFSSIMANVMHFLTLEF